jgi:hypothetical protein
LPLKRSAVSTLPPGVFSKSVAAGTGAPTVTGGGDGGEGA